MLHHNMNPSVHMNPGKKAWWKKSLVEKMAVEKKPGGKKDWSILEKMEKSLVYFFRFDTYQN